MKKLLFLIPFTFILFFFLFITPCPAKQMNLLVHPFENTGDKEYSWISAGMTDTVITDLTRIKNISVVSNQDRKKILEEMKFIFSGLAEEDKMIKLGKLTGANIIFTGSYLVSGSRIRVHARLVNVETGKAESSTKIDGTLNGIFDLQDKVVFTLMGETEKITIADIKPVNLTEQDKKKIEEKPRPSVTAYESYSKGLEVWDTKPKEALTNFKKTLEIDPNYTDALMLAGITAGNTLNLFNEGLGYLEKAERIFKGRNETKSSGYASLMMNIGSVYWSKGQLDRALEYYLNSQSIRDGLGLQNTDGYAVLMMNIGLVYRGMGQLDRALEYYLNSQSIYDRLGLQNTAGYANLMYGMAVLYEKQGQRDMAGRYYRMAYDTYVRADYSGKWREDALNNAKRLGY
jgi:TolB-like protein